MKITLQLKPSSSKQEKLYRNNTVSNNTKHRVSHYWFNYREPREFAESRQYRIAFSKVVAGKTQCLPDSTSHNDSWMKMPGKIIIVIVRLNFCGIMNKAKCTHSENGSICIY